MKTPKRDLTGGNRENGERDLCSLRSLLLNSGRGVVEIDFNLANSEGVNIYSRRDGDADFIFLACRPGVGRRRARDTQTPYLDNRPLKVAGKPEIREYKAMFVLNDAEIGIFSHELVVNCAP